LVFSGPSGEAYGYADEMDADGVFHYFGEGQSGDMKFVAGNAAIWNHAHNEKELHLFKQAGRGRFRYFDEMLCTGFEWRPAKDRNGSMRKAIVFQLVSLSGFGTDAQELSSAPVTLTELAAIADDDPTEESAPRRGIRKTFARSQALKRYVRMRAAGRCEGCGESAPFLTIGGAPFLEAHHTRRRSDEGPGDRTSVIALCPNCHARVHYGKDGPIYNESLKKRLVEIEAAGSAG
jgi:5-methylcytosine-specific restriction protein A